MRGEIDRIGKDSSLMTQLERKYEGLIKEVRSLEGDLADYNLAMDKARTGCVSMARERRGAWGKPRVSAGRTLGRSYSTTPRSSGGTSKRRVMWTRCSWRSKSASGEYSACLTRRERTLEWTGTGKGVAYCRR